MRDQLTASEGMRTRFRATFVRTGKKTNYHGYTEDTILLRDIRTVSDNALVADHVWFGYTKSFEAVRLVEGDVIEFDARVKEYKKGYVNKRLNVNQRRSDYKLSNPTKIKVVNR